MVWQHALQERVRKQEPDRVKKGKESEQGVSLSVTLNITPSSAAVLSQKSAPLPKHTPHEHLEPSRCINIPHSPPYNHCVFEFATVQVLSISLHGYIQEV